MTTTEAHPHVPQAVTPLLASMTAAAHAVGAFLAQAPVTMPAATDWAEFKRRFDALDRPATELFRERLSAVRPQAVWADELDTRLPATGEAWVVDALDGAVQFLQDLPHWSVSVALVRDGRPVAAVLHAPVRGETYTAEAGRGAHRDGRPLEPSRKTDLSLCVLGAGQPPTVAREPAAVRAAGRSLSAVLPHAGAVRNLGPTSWQIADVAAGRLDGFWQYGTDDGNLLGAALVAAEAGLPVTDLAGRPWQAGATGFLTAPAPLHARLLDLLGTAG
ncbi:inositol monophosphatase family protein [Streptantibioticus silvisoli]|uniref:Inositol monophosphatase n=1 Tax=Streptantibioticus silvisoli TaxID=2705255 RepID=A0ABT6VX61_9ACTN|nr:inositol monophosphatase [Streptantibioticus silvisoli]MDI5963024.1 inositol monophosphatase [Streptantibioticus silvisoli]